QGAETTITPPELPRREMNQPKKTEESPQPVFATRPAQQNDKDASPPVSSPEISRQRAWPIFMAGMVVMACLGGTGLWVWSQLNQPDALIQNTTVYHAVAAVAGERRTGKAGCKG
ncbi:hypothetical protein, partial [Pseudomonas aeruginosa]|uniref:hypothetical protein n=1 Tax=Pseudomonas aeruginosa TaxID=287 RepID=UPI0031B6FDBB